MAEKIEGFRLLDELSELKWGYLVATWAHRKPVPALEHIPAEKLQQPVTLADLQRQIRLVGISATNPEDYYTCLKVVREKPGTLLVRLPEEGELSRAEQGLTNGTLDYRLARFYETFLGPLHADTVEKKKEFQSCRIGDYAIASCM